MLASLPHCWYPPTHFSHHSPPTWPAGARRKKAGKAGTRRRDVPEAVAAKLGQANLLYAMQQHHEAIALLMEVIRLAPNLPDPYHTLGLLHEAVGDVKKVSRHLLVTGRLQW